MKSRAIVRHASDIDPAVAFDRALEQLSTALGAIEPKILRADWITDVESMTWADFNAAVEKTRRNYYKRGFALPDFSIAFTPLELNANLMLYSRDNENGAFNADNSNVYCRQRFDADFPTLKPEAPVIVFDTAGIFVIDGFEPRSIDQSGHRSVSHIDLNLITRLARNGAQHLARQILDSGKFIYGRLPCFDRILSSYNSLRHFSSTFAMLDVLETYNESSAQSEFLRQAITRSIDYGVKTFVRWRQLPDGTQVAYIEEPASKEIKLGALGISIVALAKFTDLMHTQKYLPLMNALARGIATMQNDDGSFVHVLNSSDFTVKEPFRIVYYDGEAVFGLMRLYSFTRDERLLEASKRAFDRFIATNHWKHHDHWLSYAVNELTKYEPRAEYFEFGLNNVLGHLRFVRNRDTQFPTLMELMMAADTMLERMKSMPEMSALLSSVNFDEFYAALEERAANMLNGYFYPETAMFFARPESIIGAFFMRHHEFRVRNDDVEHFLSGFAAYRRYLDRCGSKVVEEKIALPEEKLIVHVEQTAEEKIDGAEIFFAGDLVVARRMHWRVNEVKQFGNIPAMRNADLRIVNLESVISTVGEQGVEKGEGGPYYYHARPEMTNLLTSAHIDVALTANNHCGDYGPEAVLEQLGYLDRAGIIHVGSGKNLDEASKPVFVKVKNMVVAIFSVDTITKNFAATEDKAGTWHLPVKDIELWRSIFVDKIADARHHADLVFIAPHWGDGKKPLDHIRTLGRVLIDCGADAVLGCHSHNLHGVENYGGRPIIYDAGNFLFESAGGEKDTGGFLLTVDRSGVRRVTFSPLRNGYGYVVPATRSRDRINNWFVEMCRELETEATIKDGIVEIDFMPPDRSSSAIEILPSTFDPSKLEHQTIEPLSEPRPEWTVERVPDEAILSPKWFGPLKMIGYRVPPECRTMTSRRMLYVETYWTIHKPLDKDCRLEIIAPPVRECRVSTFGAGMDHDFCDWQFPVKRWKPGVIYREKFGLRPPYFNRLFNVDLRIEIRVRIDGQIWGPFRDPQPIKLALTNIARYNYDFPDVIYKSKLGQCWNAKQLAAVTGGRWLVEPPEGWYIQSLLRTPENHSIMPKPTLFVANTQAQHAFHAGGTPTKWDSHVSIKKCLETTAGAMISHPVEGLPPDYPLLLVDDPVRRSMELGFAARQRFQGRTIAVTGSSGKTTTCYMLRHVLGHDHEVAATYGSVNTRVMVPYVFASVRQDAAFAIIEVAVSALSSPRGSITYEIRPDIAVVTSLTTAHAEEYKSIENLANFKSCVMCGMAPGGYAILNRDMPCYEVFEERANKYSLNIISFGTHPDSTIRMERLENGGVFTVEGQSYRLECPGPNEQLYDALAVIGVAKASGLPIEEILELLKTFETVEGRGNIINTSFNGKKLRVINSSFNANPLSMKGSLCYLKSLEADKKRRVAILGDMLELGADTIKQHRAVSTTLFDAEPNRVLLVGELMKYLYDDIKEKINGAWFPTYKELNAALDGWLRDGDTVLIKSSHGTHLDHVVEHLKPANR